MTTKEELLWYLTEPALVRTALAARTTGSGMQNEGQES